MAQLPGERAFPGNSRLLVHADTGLDSLHGHSRENTPREAGGICDDHPFLAEARPGSADAAPG